MASADLDPLFLKALKLLQSRSKESRDQLRQLYDEVVAQRKAEVAGKRSSDGYETMVRVTGGSGFVKKENIENERKRDFDKANLEKLKQDLAELSQDVPLKKPKLESSSSSSSSNSPRSVDVKERNDRKMPAVDTVKEKPRERLREIEEDIFFGPSPTVLSSNRAKEREREEREKLAKLKEKETKEKKEIPLVVSTVADDSGSETEVSGDETVLGDNEEQMENMDEMQFDFIGNLSCVICKTLNVTSSNRLLECQECHNLYHQECHKPPVTDNVADPRFVWYCSKCTKNMKKIVIKTQKKPPVATTTSRESPVFKQSSKPEPQSATLLQPFKRIDPPRLSSGKESSTSGVPQGAGIGRGLAGLAANLNNRSTTSVAASDSLKVKSEPPNSSNTARNMSSTSRQESSKAASSSDSKPSSVSPGWATINRSAPSTSTSIGKPDGSKPKLVMSSSSTQKTLTSPPPATGATGLNSSSGKMSQSTMMSADKRLQIMKKKAAAKMAEKRTR